MGIGPIPNNKNHFYYIIYFPKFKEIMNIILFYLFVFNVLDKL